MRGTGLQLKSFITLWIVNSRQPYPKSVQPGLESVEVWSCYYPLWERVPDVSYSHGKVVASDLFF